MSQLWLVRTAKGKLLGPFDEGQICSRIEEGELTGEEELSSYPSGKWKPLSSHPVFYNKILKRLKESGKPKEEASLLADEDPSFSDISSEKASESMTEEEEVTRIIEPKKLEKELKAMKKKKVKIELSKKFKEQDEPYEDEEEEDPDIIEMDDSISLKERLKSLPLLPVLGTVALLGILVYVFFDDSKKEKESLPSYLSLSAIGKVAEPLSEGEKKSLYLKARELYFTGSTVQIFKAQRIYAQILSSDPDKPSIYGDLCLSYLDIWPYSWQNDRDRRALEHALRLATLKDKQKTFSNICKIVKFLMDEDFKKAISLVDRELERVSGHVAVSFYYLKAHVLKGLKKEQELQHYIKLANRSEKKWLTPHLFLAKSFYEKKQDALASKLYQSILSRSPKNLEASLALGVLDYRHFKQIENSKQRLSQTLNNLQDYVPSDLLLDAHIVLAKIYKDQDPVKALEHSSKAYSLDPEDPDVQFLKNNLGKEDHFESLKVKSKGLLAKGDILVSEDNCKEAKRFYQRAYERGDSKNSLAALKIAKCYWRSGAFGQGVFWAKRATSAQDRVLESYFVLAEYLAHLYDFESANDVLKAVRNQNPSQYELLKAYAKLAYNKKNYKEAIIYGERALKLYFDDVDVYILLSEAHLKINEKRKAFLFAEKARLEDALSIKAQIAYARALSAASGLAPAEKYFTETLIQNSPSTVEYRQALAELYFEKNRMDKAQAQLEFIVEGHPNFKPAWFYLGRVFAEKARGGARREKNLELSLKYFTEAALLDISDPDPVFYAGQALLYANRPLPAEKRFKKVLSLSPNYPLIHYYIGLANFHQQGDLNLDNALQFSAIQARKTPNSYLPYKLAGDVYKVISEGAFAKEEDRRKNYELCAMQYQKALKIMKADFDISVNLIDCYKGMGDYDSALNLAKILSSEEGTSGEGKLYRTIASLYEDKQEYESARSMYCAYFELDPGAKDRRAIEARIKEQIPEGKMCGNSK